MGRYLSSFSFDRISFWLGFLAGLIFFWLLSRARPWLTAQFQAILVTLRSTKESITAGSDVRIRNDIIRFTEQLHLANQLFSLSEVLIHPRLLAPPPLVEPGLPPPPEDITAQTIPYIPDFPELAATYNAPTFTLVEALQGGANLVLIGHLGSGKTVAMAHLANRLSRSDRNFGTLTNLTPVFVHVGDLVLSQEIPDQRLTTLVNAVSQYVTSMNQSRLENFLDQIFRQGEAILLVDGMDELPPIDFTKIVDFLSQLIQEYPTLRVVATASPYYYDGLTSLGFIPVPMAIWGDVQKAAFLERWSRLWMKFVSQASEEDDAVNPTLLNAWLLNDKTPYSPLEFTLKVWATYAGDILGPKLIDSIESYIRRMTVGTLGSRPGLENIASQALISQRPFFNQKEARSWVAEFDKLVQSPPSKEQVESAQSSQITQEFRSEDVAPVSRIISALTDNGMLCTLNNQRIRFIHPTVVAYLAGCGFDSLSKPENFPKSLEWAVNSDTLSYLLAQRNDSPIVAEILEESQAPLELTAVKIGRWLSLANENSRWNNSAMRKLAIILQNDYNPLSLRSRALVALSSTRNAGVSTLLKQLMESELISQRQLAALGTGILRDPKLVQSLNSLLEDAFPITRQAACLALVAIADRQSLEYVADALIGGDEDLRRSAAEALANNVEEGYPTLREGASIDDVLVRKASIFGLQRIALSWSTDIIEKLHVEDEQWVVKDAASQALHELALPNPRIPKPFPQLHNLPWLIAFAGERGIGVAPGKAAWDLLMLSLREGNEEQMIAALQFLAIHGNASAIQPIQEMIDSNSISLDVKEAAYNTLFSLTVSSILTPDIVKHDIAQPE